MNSKDLAEIVSIIGVEMLRKNKRNISQIIEASIPHSYTIKKILKNELHASYERIKENLSTYAESKEEFYQYLKDFESANKEKNY